MEIMKSDIVLSMAGRDKKKLFFVWDAEELYLYLVDGKTRKMANPKKKKRKHVLFITRSDAHVAEKIRMGEHIQDSEIRRALSEHVSKRTPQHADEGGILLG